MLGWTSPTLTRDSAATLAPEADRFTFIAPRDGVIKFFVRAQILTTIPAQKNLSNTNFQRKDETFLT